MVWTAPVPVPDLVSVPWTLPQLPAPADMVRLKPTVLVLPLVPPIRRPLVVEPATVPALRPTLYGVVLVQVTCSVVLLLTVVASTPCDEPKSSGWAAMVQSAMICTVTSKVVVLVPLL